MWQKLKVLVWVAMVVGIAGLFWRVLSQWKERPRTTEGGALSGSFLPGKSKGKIDLGNVFIEGPHMTGWAANGKPLWEVWAQRIEFTEKNQQVRLIKARGNYYENGAPASVFEAGLIQVTLAKSDKLLHMTDEVVAHWGRRGVTLRSHTLDWRFDRKQVVGQQGVQFTKAKWKLTGREVRADLSMKRVQMTGGTRLESLG